MRSKMTGHHALSRNVSPRKFFHEVERKSVHTTKNSVDKAEDNFAVQICFRQSLLLLCNIDNRPLLFTIVGVIIGIVAVIVIRIG